MTSIDGLLAILEDRGLMPAVALFSLTAVLGLLYLSSGNPQAPNPHLRRSRVNGGMRPRRHGRFMRVPSAGHP